jgi:hypothetical protein
MFSYLKVFLTFFLVLAPVSGVWAGDPRLNVDDLGFSAQETKSDPHLQSLLAKRSHSLKTHQVLALFTAVPMTVNAFLPPQGVGRSRSGGVTAVNSTKKNLALHEALGLTTFGLYTATACFALFAPKPPGLKRKGSTRIHRYLAIIHGSAMLAVPILGEMAKAQIDKGQRVSGTAKLHGAAVSTLLLSYWAALGVMVIKF